MKKKNDNNLWVQSLSTADVSLSDLGIKVLAGHTVNVYKVNPYLTVDQVKKSLESGALFKRLSSNVLRVVKKKIIDIPKTLNHIKESNKTVQAKKTKSSVVIESNMESPGEEGSFDFADYGVNDLGPSVTQSKEDGSVVVSATQDEAATVESDTKLEPELESGVSKQSQVIMKHTQEAMVDPTGPIAKSSEVSTDQPFMVAKSSQSTEETETTSDIVKHITKDESGSVVVGGKKKSRSIKKVNSAHQNKEDSDEDDPEIDMNETEFDSKVATKTKDGSIVMKLKEDEP